LENERAEQVLAVGQGQIKYTHVNKCKNNKIKQKFKLEKN
jgi:hypothetical protein